MTNTLDHDERVRAAKKGKFLEAYRAHGVIGPACSVAGIGRTTFKRWRQEDEEFAAAVQDAYDDAVDAGEAELRARGVVGVDEPVLYKGEPVWRRDPQTGELLLDDDFEPIPFTINRRSDRLLEVYVRSHRPQYKERTEVSMTGPDGGPVKQDVTVRYVLPDGRTVGDYDGDGPDPLED